MIGLAELVRYRGAERFKRYMLYHCKFKMVFCVFHTSTAINMSLDGRNPRCGYLKTQF